MRVHLGCDHAGLDLKDHLTRWLTEHGYEPVDHGPFSTTRSTTTRSSACAPPRRVAHERAAGRDSLGVVIGGSGNGEQMAANKVRRHPLPRWSGRRRPRGWPASTTTPTSSRSAAGCTRSRT